MRIDHMEEKQKAPLMRGEAESGNNKRVMREK
jgi:hypothetical protein